MNRHGVFRILAVFFCFAFVTGTALASVPAHHTQRCDCPSHEMGSCGTTAYGCCLIESIPNPDGKGYHPVSCFEYFQPNAEKVKLFVGPVLRRQKSEISTHPFAGDIILMPLRC